jgi:hypothetical protein
VRLVHVLIELCEPRQLIQTGHLTKERLREVNLMPTCYFL